MPPKRRHLTDHGRSLWRQQREMGPIGADGKYEHDEQEFIELFLMGPPGVVADCWRCGNPRKLIRGAFCLGCVSASYV